QLHLLVGGQQGGAADLAQVDGGRVRNVVFEVGRNRRLFLFFLFGERFGGGLLRLGRESARPRFGEVVQFIPRVGVPLDELDAGLTHQLLRLGRIHRRVGR